MSLLFNAVKTSNLRKTIGQAVGIATLLSILTIPAYAQDAQPVASGAGNQQAESCVLADVYQTMADAFAADPNGFFDDYANNGVSIAIPARNIAVVNPGALADILSQIDRFGLDSSQARQIVIGLGQATLMCARTNFDAAVEIQSAIAEIDNDALQLAFLSVTGEVQTAAIGDPAGQTAVGGIPTIGNNNDGGIAGAGLPDDPIGQRTDLFAFARNGVTGTRTTALASASVISPTSP